MACGCSKSKTFTASNPLIIGDDDGSAPQQYRTTVAMLTLRAGATFWGKGTGIAAMLVAGWLVAVA